MDEVQAEYDERGKLKKGSVINPNGNNGHNKGWQRYGTRSKMLLMRYTADEIRELVQDKAAFGKLSTIDAIIIRHIAGCLAGEDVRGERTDLIDRIDGKARQPLTGGNDEDGDKDLFPKEITIKLIPTPLISPPSG